MVSSSDFSAASSAQACSGANVVDGAIVTVVCWLLYERGGFAASESAIGEGTVSVSGSDTISKY